MSFFRLVFVLFQDTGMPGHWNLWRLQGPKYDPGVQNMIPRSKGPKYDPKYDPRGTRVQNMIPGVHRGIKIQIWSLAFLGSLGFK